MSEIKNNDVNEETVDTEMPLDKNVRLMSPSRMVIRRFFRSKLSIIGLIMVVGLFLFSFNDSTVLSEFCYVIVLHNAISFLVKCCDCYLVKLLLLLL